MADALVLEGADMEARAKADELYERAGHEGRAKLDERYKRATWGLRPEDVAAQQEFMAQMQGRR